MKPTTTARPVLAVALALAAALVAIAGRSPKAAETPTSAAVTLEPLKFDVFKARLAAGKNVKFTLVDVWSTTCAPCKANFPHLVEMHHKYAPKGLRAVSLSLDDTSDPKAVEAARAFLREKKATFLNVLLDEEFGVGFDKLDINTIPAVFLYAPDGKLVRKYTMDDPNHQFTYDEVEKDVAALLEGKAATGR